MRSSPGPAAGRRVRRRPGPGGARHPRRARPRPSEVRPEDTHGELDENGSYLRLRIPHASEPRVRLDLVYGDGYVSLTWPGGEEHDAWEWSPLLATTVEALVCGRNEQTVHGRFGRVFATDPRCGTRAAGGFG